MTVELMIISVASLITLGLGFSYVRLLLTRVRRLELQVDQFKNEIRAVNSGHLGMGRTLNRMVASIRDIENEQHTVTDSNNDERTYSQAAKLLQKGSSIDDIVDACELSRAEVELLAVIHKSASLHSA